MRKSQEKVDIATIKVGSPLPNILLFSDLCRILLAQTCKQCKYKRYIGKGWVRLWLNPRKIKDTSDFIVPERIALKCEIFLTPSLFYAPLAFLASG